MPLYKQQLERSPLPLYNLHIEASFQSWGTIRDFQTLNIILHSALFMFGPPCLYTSAGRLSDPGDLLFSVFALLDDIRQEKDIRLNPMSLA